MIEIIEKLSKLLGIGYFRKPYEYALISYAVGKIKSEHYRHYHTIENHILPMCEAISKLPLSWEEKEIFIWAALYHDIVYDVFDLKKGNNEENSQKLWEEKAIEFSVPQNIITSVSELILATIPHESNDSKVNEFLKLDLANFSSSLDEVLRQEALVRKEFEYVDWEVYKTERIKILTNFANNNSTIKQIANAQSNILAQVEYLKFHTPKIAVYPGSFSPFHKGHLNVLQQAEKIFDKVILVFAQNPEKETSNKVLDNIIARNSIPSILKYKQVEFLQTTSMAEWIQQKPYPVTLIRGLRNAKDLAYEQDYLFWLNQIATNPINVVAIFADKAFENISSSAIKNLMKVDPEKAKQFYF